MTSSSKPKLILIYAGYGDTLLLQIQPKDNSPNLKPYTRPRFWLIDGGPIFNHQPTRKAGKGKKKKAKVSQAGEEGLQSYNAYYQYLRGALLRHCRSDPKGDTIDLLEGIIVTHPHRDHMDGVIQLVADWLPDKGKTADGKRPLSFKGPVILNGRFFQKPFTAKDESGLVLTKLLEKKGFVKYDLNPRDPDIPLELSNMTISNEPIYKMMIPSTKNTTSIVSTTTSPTTSRLSDRVLFEGRPNLLRNPKSRIVTIDDSEINKTSIISIWKENEKESIVATGDNIGSIILDTLGQDTDMGIFKVPHHGGQRNSLVDEEFLFKEVQQNNETAEFFFLYLVAHTFATSTAASGALRNKLTAFKGQHATAVYNRWTGTEDDDNEDEDEDEDEDDNNNNNNNGDDDNERTTDDFEHFLGKTAEAFTYFLNYIKFEYNKSKLYNEENADTLNFDGVGKLAEVLLERYDALKDAVSKGEATTAKNLLDNSPLKVLPRKSSGNKQGFTIEEFKQDPALSNDIFLPTQVKKIKERDHFDKNKEVEVDKRIYPEEYEDIVKALKYSRCQELLRLKGLLCFYKKVRANNYAISAQGKHGHPNPNTISAIMAAAIIRWQPNQNPIRIFVTDAGSLKISRIRSGVKFLIENSKLTIEKWQERVQLFYLENDYQVEIPVDSSPVGGCTNFRFDIRDDQVEQRKVLGEQFRRSSAYNLPISSQVSDDNFVLFLLGSSFKPIGWLKLDITGSIPKLAVADITTSSKAPLLQLQCAGRVVATNQLNRTKFSLIFEVPPTTILPGEFAFESITVSGQSATFTLLNVTSQEFLCYNKDTKELSWEPAASATSKARLRFERRGPRHPSLDRSTWTQTSASTSFQIRPSSSYITAMLAHSKFEAIPFLRSLDLDSSKAAELTSGDSNGTKEAFKDWWKRVGPSPSPSPVTLRNVIDAALGEEHAAVIASKIPKAPFVFASVMSFSVDITGSPDVTYNKDGEAVVTALLVLPDANMTIEITGIGMLTVTSLSAVISTRDRTLVLNAGLSGSDSVSAISFTFSDESSTRLYLDAVGYQGSVKRLSFAGLAGSIIGTNFIFGYFCGLPPSICTMISLPTWLVDEDQTKIAFGLTPLGVDVSKAEISAVIPDALREIDIAGFKFSIISAKLLLVGSLSDTLCPFHATLYIGLRIFIPPLKFDFRLKVTLNGKGLLVLDVLASSPMNLFEVFRALQIPPPGTEMKLPLGGQNIPLWIKFDYIGFTFLQSCAETTQFKLQSIYFRISAEILGVVSWKDSLPEKLQPQQLSDVTLTVTLLSPLSWNTVSICLQVDFPLHVSDATADLLLSFSVWPINANTAGTSVAQCMSISVLAEKSSKKRSPTISDILDRLAGRSWSDVIKIFPFLASITNAISFTQASLEIGKDSNNKLVVSAFSVEAQISDCSFLSQPALTVEKGLLTIEYNKFTGWTGRIGASILFAVKYRCSATFILPTASVAGKISFSNSDDNFNLGALVKEIDSAIDLSSVPLIGSDALASVKLGSIILGIEYVNGKIALTGFSIRIDWDVYAIGQINTFGNCLSVSWKKDAFSNIPSIEGSPSIESQSVWRVEWEGQISNVWALSATAQYSKITGGTTTDPQTKLVLDGSILNMSGVMQIGDLTNVLTHPPGSERSTLWQDKLPSKVSGSFLLQSSTANCVIGTPAVYAVGARATWGQASKGTAVLIVRKINGTANWSFMAAIAVDKFRFSDLYSDSELAVLIDNNLSLVRASVLAFHSPETTTLKQMKTYLANTKMCRLLPVGGGFIPLEDVSSDTELKYVSGVAIFATLNFHTPPPESLTSNLDVVSNSVLSSSSLAIQLASFFGTTTDSSRVVIFEGSIDSLQLLSSAKLREIQLRFTSKITKATPKSIVTNTFFLGGKCYLQIAMNHAWVLTGSLLVESSKANLNVQLLSEEKKLSETIGLKISGIALSIQYTFTSNVVDDDGNPNSGVVKSGNRSAKYSISLSASVALGSIKGNVSLVFLSGSPEVLVIDFTSDVNVGILFREIFGDQFPADLLDISFRNLLTYYSWQDGVHTSTVARGPRDGLYLKGFHAEADVNVYGIAFLLNVDIGSSDQKGIRMTATLAQPVKVVCVTLHSKTSASLGPSFGLSTYEKDKGCFFAAGISLFGTELPGNITLSFDPSIPGLRGTITIKGSFIQGGSADIIFELSRRDGKNCLRFVNLPAVFQDIIDAVKLIENINKLSSMDKSPCGAITLAFNEAVKSTITVDVRLDDSQGGLNPQTGPAGIDEITLSLKGHFEIRIGDHAITGIELKPLICTINVPRKLDALWDSLVDSLKKSALQIIKGLWEDKDNLKRVIALIALKKLSLRAIQALICRDYYKPTADQGDKPGDNQKAESEGSEDGGGVDGDGAGPGGAGPGLGGTGVLPLGGAAAFSAFLAALADGVATTLPVFLSGLLGVIPPLLAATTTLPEAPKDPGIPREPPADDEYAKVIRDALNKNFERWSVEEDFGAALQSALDCALDYRIAIGFLRKVLSSPTTVENLGQKMLEDYRQRRKWLMYKFSLLSHDFAEKWLDMSPVQVSISFTPTNTGRKLLVKWKMLREHPAMVTTLTLYIKGNPEIKMKVYDTDSMTTDGPQFDLLNGTQITAKVVAFAAISGGDPGYAFSSQGLPASKSYTEVPPTITTMDATKQPSAPDGLDYYNLTGPNSTTTDLSNYPVFCVGQYTYWPLSYSDSVVFAILDFDQDGNLFGRWNKAGARYIYKITYDNTNQTVTFFGQSDKSVSLTIKELLNPPYVVTLDANKAPAPPDGLKYRHITSANANDNDLANYPVLCIGKYTYWALSYTDDRNDMVILAYDLDGALRRKWKGIGAHYLHRIFLSSDSATFYGESSQAVAFTFDELEVPYVTTQDANNQPAPPSDLKYKHITGSSNTDDDLKNYPVLVIGKYTYWALSFTDNRISLALLAFKDGKQCKRWEDNGARYVYRIALGDTSATFYGESNQAIAWTFDGLKVT